MEKEMNNRKMKELFRAVAALKTEAECKKFLRDLCTLAELKAMSERWQVANQVNRNAPYRVISRNTGTSTATITRVAHWLHHGTGGYQLALKRLKGLHAA